MMALKKLCAAGGCRRCTCASARPRPARGASKQKCPVSSVNQKLWITKVGMGMTLFRRRMSRACLTVPLTGVFVLL